MSARVVAVFVHLIGVVSLFIAMGLTQRAGAGLRRAKSIEEVRVWLSVFGTASPMFPASFLLIVASGLYMSGQFWSFDTPFVVIGLICVVLMGLLGAGVAGRGFAEMSTLASTESITEELARSIAASAPWVAFGAVNGLAVGVLWLMVGKPGWAQSAAIALGAGLIGAGAGYAVNRRTSAARTT